MELVPSVFALQRAENGEWRVWAPPDDPYLPARTTVGVIGESTLVRDEAIHCLTDQRNRETCGR
jgi:hypothetical protein